MGSGVSRTYSGSFTGTGAAIDIKKVGFRPRNIRVFNVAAGGLCSGEWIEGMADASMFKIVSSDGTNPTNSVPTSNGITPLADGFTLGADTDLNVAGEMVRFVCHE